MTEITAVARVVFYVLGAMGYGYVWATHVLPIMEEHPISFLALSSAVLFLALSILSAAIWGRK